MGFVGASFLAWRAISWAGVSLLLQGGVQAVYDTTTATARTLRETSEFCAAWIESLEDIYSTLDDWGLISARFFAVLLALAAVSFALCQYVVRGTLSPFSSAANSAASSLPDSRQDPEPPMPPSAGVPPQELQQALERLLAARAEQNREHKRGQSVCLQQSRRG